MERKRCLLQLCDICKRVPTTFWRFKDQYLSALQNCPPPNPWIWILFWSWWPQRKRMLLWKNSADCTKSCSESCSKNFRGESEHGGGQNAPCKPELEKSHSSGIYWSTAASGVICRECLVSIVMFHWGFEKCQIPTMPFPYLKIPCETLSAFRISISYFSCVL